MLPYLSAGIQQEIDESGTPGGASHLLPSSDSTRLGLWTATSHRRFGYRPFSQDGNNYWKIKTVTLLLHSCCEGSGQFWNEQIKPLPCRIQSSNDLEHSKWR